jgi:PAS domain S-box-containing protein
MHRFSAKLDSGQDLRPTQMAEALRNLQHAVAQCHDAVFITDAAGVITRVNAAFEQLTSQSSLELVGKDLSLITEGGAQCQEYQQIWRSIFQEKPYAGTLKVRTTSDTFCEVEVTLTPVRGRRRRIVSLVGTCRVVAQPETPKPVRQNDSESDLNVVRMIHDLRNMLLVALAHADLACELLAREHPSRRHLENVKSAAQGAAALVHRFTQSEPSNRLNPISNDPQLRDAAMNRRTDTSRLLATSESERHEIAGDTTTVLLVEDESLIRESSVEFLSGAGFNVISAANGEEALQEVQQHQGSIDLLITDMVLPNMTGSELVDMVTSAHPETKVLIISGHSQPEIAQYGQEQSHFLAKPFSFSVLHTKIRELLQQKKQPRSASAGL